MAGCIRVPKVKSLKALLRKIRKWGLPVGSKVSFYGRYLGEEGEVLIKK